MGILVDIDSGGTFTDVGISDGANGVHAKSPTTPHNLTLCFLDILKQGSNDDSCPADDIVPIMMRDPKDARIEPLERERERCRRAAEKKRK